jgi:hypothetical protein
MGQVVEPPEKDKYRNSLIFKRLQVAGTGE